MNTKKEFSIARHARLKLCIATMVALYGLVAVIGGMKSPYGEYFPAFNWSLFSNVTSLRSMPEIRVHRIGNKVFEQPAEYFKLDSYFDTARRRSSDIRKNLDRFIVALMNGQPQEAAKWRRLIESQHLSGYGTVSYEIAIVTFSPVERWKTGTIRQQVILGQFETNP